MITKNKKVDSILVRCPNWVGDVVMATPTLDCLRENFPGAMIVGIAKRHLQGVLQDGPWFDTYIDCEDKSWKGFWKMVRRIRELKPDMAIVLPNSIRSFLPVWLGGVKRIYGYRKNPRRIIIKGPTPLYSGGKIVIVPTQEYYLEICRWLGLKSPAEKKPRLFIGDKVRRQGNELLQKYGIHSRDLVIGLNPGASYGSSKCWLPEYFAKTAELFEQEMGAKIMLFSGPGEEKITSAIKSRTQAQIIDTGPDRVGLELLKPLIKQCDLLVTNDTGPRHYATALDVPVAVIIGPTDPRYTETNLEKSIVLRKKIDCSPCRKKVCPKDHRCMKEITPEMVFAAGKKLLQETQ